MITNRSLEGVSQSVFSPDVVPLGNLPLKSAEDSGCLDRAAEIVSCRTHSSIYAGRHSDKATEPEEESHGVKCDPCDGDYEVFLELPFRGEEKDDDEKGPDSAEHEVSP